MYKRAASILFQRKDGCWVNTFEFKTKYASLHFSRRGAENYAVYLLMKAGGGELTVQTYSGRIILKRPVLRNNRPSDRYQTSRSPVYS